MAKLLLSMTLITTSTVALQIIFYYYNDIFQVNNKMVRVRLNVSMICQTIVHPPENNQQITREHLTCKIQYCANGGYLVVVFLTLRVL